MNSFYGVLATPACRFYSSAVANAITHFGQWVLHWARDRVEALGHRVLYGDTDSLFVLSGRSGRDGAGDALRLGPALCGRINEELRATIRETWKVESHLELEFETLFLKFFLPSVRHGGAGARKRYAGLVRAERPGAAVGEPAVAAESGAATASDAGTASGAAAEVIFVGMEVMRRDWTEMSKTFQRGLYERLFRGESAEAVSEFLRAFVSELRAGRHDRQLVYRKALRKGLEEYTATTPPHVKAARKLGGNVRGLVEYVMTTSGPEAASARGSAIDYEHYVEKQIRPIAEQVLTQLGISFEQALGETRQGTLF